MRRFEAEPSMDMAGNQQKKQNEAEIPEVEQFLRATAYML